MNNSKRYCKSLTEYLRRETRVVNIGNLPLGGNNPIRIQSMTTTDTMDTISTVEQSIRMIKAGSEYIRITAPSIKEANNLYNIKKELRNRGFHVPVIADIHFTPNAAIEAARIVEKVRINPGNFADKKKFETIDYNDKTYNEELERIYKRFSPLVKVCKEEGTVMRIGTNHGSLSDRILSRYGDTPNGMVESALEFIRICEDDNFYDIVLSMKSSNTRVMVQAYRLLVHKMNLENMNYPLHLGVTEAGFGEDGRIKSSVGIGALLEDGLGDTIRVSLTEDPEFELPVANSLVNRYKERSKIKKIQEINNNPLFPFEYNKRNTHCVLNIGGENVARVISDLSCEKMIDIQTLNDVGYFYYNKEDKWGISDFACDYIYIGDKEIDFIFPETLGIVQNYNRWKLNKSLNHYPLFNLDQYQGETVKHNKLNFIKLTLYDLDKLLIDKIINDKSVVLIVETYNAHGMAEQRRFFIKVINQACTVPIIINRSYLSKNDMKNFQIYSATDMGALLIDGLGDGVLLSVASSISKKEVNNTAFSILQASRVRTSKTEYISCPSCGRTLFDLKETTELIRKQTDHLKGVKIGIMGCIVNGPGEMADADYGYVGTGINKISLYRGQKVVKPHISAEKAVDSLIELIKEDGLWVDPVTV